MAALDDIREKIEGIDKEDIAAGAELVSEAVAGEVQKISEGIANTTPEDVSAGAELVSEAVNDAVKKVTEQK